MSQPQLQPVLSKPRLLFFRSATSGRCRNIDSYLAHVLTAGRNHATFEVTHVDVHRHAALAEKLRVNQVPTFVLVAEGRSIGRLDDIHEIAQIREFLQPWLKRSQPSSDRENMAMQPPKPRA
jgi:thioredoxin-like negative regulator of GroEL